jgi:hypothetical protein
MTEPSPEDIMFEYASERVAEDEQSAKAQQKKEKAADILIRLAGGAEELFHAPDGTGFAIIPVGDHLETWPVRSKGFKRWLAREFFTETASASNSDAIQSALNVIEARAHFDGRQRPVYVRVAAFDGRLYLDLADARWRAIEISSSGWQIVERPPIAFRRAAGMQVLPDPIRGGSIKDLREFLNVGEDNDSDFVLAVSFVLAALRDRGPYPVLCLAGEHGSAKSTFTAVLRKLIDPNSAPFACPAARGPRSIHCCEQRAFARLRQRLAVARLDLGHAVPTIAVRVPRRPNIPENKEAPNPEKLPWDFSRVKFAPLFEPKLEPEFVDDKCWHCDGTGYQHKCPDCRCVCEYCNASGKFPPRVLDAAIAEASADIEKAKHSKVPPPVATDEEDVEDNFADEQDESDAKKMAMAKLDYDF